MSEFILTPELKSTLLQLIEDEERLSVDTLYQYKKLHSLSRGISRLKNEASVKGGVKDYLAKRGFVKKSHELSRSIEEEAEIFQKYTKDHLDAQVRLTSAVDEYLSGSVEGYKNLAKGFDYLMQSELIVNTYSELIDAALIAVQKTWNVPFDFSVDDVIDLDTVKPQTTQDILFDVVRYHTRYSASLDVYNSFLEKESTSLFSFTPLHTDISAIPTTIFADGFVQPASIEINLNLLGETISSSLSELRKQQKEAYSMKETYTKQLLLAVKK